MSTVEVVFVLVMELHQPVQCNSPVDFGHEVQGAVEVEDVEVEYLLPLAFAD